MKPIPIIFFNRDGRTWLDSLNRFVRDSLLYGRKNVLIGIRSRDSFNSMMCIGIGTLFMSQIFIN